MASTTFDYIKAGPGGNLPDTVGVSIDSMPAGSKGTPLGAFMRPMGRTIYPASDLVSYTPYGPSPTYSTQHFYGWNWKPERFTTTGRWDRDANDLNNHAHLRYNGSSNWQGAEVSGALEFYFHGSALTCNLSRPGTSDFRWYIDDMPVTRQWEHWNGGGVSTTRNCVFQFASTKTRKMKLFLGGTMGWRAMYFTGGDEIWPAEKRFRVAMTGDSYLHGSGETREGVINGGTIANELAIQAGWDVWNLGQGGTGYSNPGFSVVDLRSFGHPSRITAMQQVPQLDLMICYGGGNDVPVSTYPIAGTVTAANACWNSLKAAQPTVPLIVVGIQSIESSSYALLKAEMDALNAALKAAAEANPNVHAFIDMRSSPWVPGTGDDGNKNGTGISDIVISSDRVHPTHFGNRYLTQRLIHMLANIRI